MSDYSNHFYLTEDEVVRIEAWVSENRYSLSSGNFELRFEFSPIGDLVELWFWENENCHFFEVSDDMRSSLDELRTADHIVIDGVRGQLKLSDTSLEKFFKIGRECTEAHINEDCEPPGSSLSFKVHGDGCSVFADGQLIEVQQ